MILPMHPLRPHHSANLPSVGSDPPKIPPGPDRPCLRHIRPAFRPLQSGRRNLPCVSPRGLIATPLRSGAAPSTHAAGHACIRLATHSLQDEAHPRAGDRHAPIPIPDLPKSGRNSSCCRFQRLAHEPADTCSATAHATCITGRVGLSSPCGNFSAMPRCFLHAAQRTRPTSCR
jgi:hypothetical protein